MYVYLLFSFLRSAKEQILSLSQVSSAGDVGRTDMLADDSVFEETIIAEYALVISGHSLVRYSACIDACRFYSVAVLLSAEPCISVLLTVPSL